MNPLDKIQNPKTNKWVNISSKTGKKVLTNYINMLNMAGGGGGGEGAHFYPDKKVSAAEKKATVARSLVGVSYGEPISEEEAAEEAAAEVRREYRARLGLA
jgi:hypothetical protein